MYGHQDNLQRWQQGCESIIANSLTHPMPGVTTCHWTTWYDCIIWFSMEPGCSALRWFTCNFWQLFGRYFMRNKINTLTELIKKPAKFFFLPGENAFYTLHWATVSLFSPHRCQQCAQPHDASFPLWKCFVQLSSFIVCQHWGLLSLQYTLGPKEIS